jgi:hypothetical protein
MKNLCKNLPNSFSSKWQNYLFITIAAIGISILFLWKVQDEIPMGDSYIHFLYARNLVLHGELSYNPGLNEGIGSSSILWVVILASFNFFGGSPVITSKYLGVGFLILSGILVFELTEQILTVKSQSRRYLKSTLISLFAMMSGSMIWLTLSGMETMLFVTLALFSIYLYARESWTLLGISLGLLALTRIEGITLTGVIILVELFRSRQIDRKLLKIIIPLFLILAPWLIYLQMREGVPVSTSFHGRQFVVSEVEERISTQFPHFFWLQKINPLVHVASWVYFILIYISGSISLPGPVLDLGGDLVGTELTIPIAGIIVGLVCLPLILLSFKHFLKSMKPQSLNEPRQRLQIVIISWILIFNLAYAVFLPRVGAAGRYIPMNHMFFWICLLIGSTLIRKKFIKRISYVFIIILLGVSINYWRMVYQSNVNYLVNVRKQAAKYIDEQFPLDKPIGATDLGAIGYYSQHQVVDLFGHINKDFNNYLSAGGNIPDYLVKERLCYLMLFDSQGNSGLNFADEMGLINDPRFTLTIENSFSVEVDEWSLGNGPIRNYMPAVNVYRVNWQDDTICP